MFYKLLHCLFIFLCINNSAFGQKKILQSNTPKKTEDSLIIDGYCQRFSFYQHDTVAFYLNAKQRMKEATIGVYNIEHQLVDFIKCDISPQNTTNTDAYKNGFGYKFSTKYIVPKKLKSGMYFLGNDIPFLVKNSSKTKSKIAIIHPSNTDIAYNNKGGMSYYYPSHKIRARVLSKERPWVFSENGNPIEFYKWIDKQSLQIDYLCDEDLENFEHIKDYKLLIFTGHSEYWTRPAREIFDKYIDEKHNALILSGNMMYWQVRYEAYEPNQQICYKYDAFSSDPTKDMLMKTSRWEDARLQYNPLNSIGLSYYYNGGFSISKNGFGGYKILKPQNELFKGTGLKYNEVLKFNADEYDGATVTFIKNDKNPSESYPIYNNSLTKFYKVELLAYDLCEPDWGGTDIHTGAIIALKRKTTSGVIINTGASNWCKEIAKPEIQKVTLNAINILLNQKSVNNLFLK
jgi:hypothetical protein